MSRFWLLVVLIIFICTPAEGQSVGRESLAHLDGIRIQVQPLSEKVERAGLTRSKIRDQIELTLRRAGIDIHNRLESGSTKSMAYLYVNVFVLITPKEFSVYVVSVSVRQSVSLSNGLAEEAETYLVAPRAGSLSSSNLPVALEILQECLNQFVDDWSRVH